MYLVQESGHPLNLVEHDGLRLWQGGELRAKQRWLGQQGMAAGLVEQIDDMRTWKRRPRPCGFTDTADAEEEEAPGGGCERAPVIVHVAVIIACKMTTW